MSLARTGGFIILVYAGVFLCGSRATASPITFDFAGTFALAPAGSLIPPFGQTISGFYTFESTTPGKSLSPTDVNYSNAISAFGYTSGSYTGGFQGPESDPLQGPPFNNINIVNGTGGGLNGLDSYQVNLSLTGASIAGQDPRRLELTLIDPSGAAFSTTDLPLVPPDLAVFGGSAVINFANTTGTEGSIIVFRVTSLTLRPAAVSAPTSLLLVLSGIAGLFVLKKSLLKGRRVSDKF